MKAVILFSKKLKEYDFGEGHPFHGRRGEVFLEFFKKNIKNKIPILKTKAASDKDLFLICDKEYIEFTQTFFNTKKFTQNFNRNFYLFHSPDNYPRKNSGKIEEAARFIIGQAKLAADLIFQKKFKKVISIGGGLHHAKKNYGEGFCIYNDVAFCAKYLLEKYKLDKILILDTDAHCGNGTMEYFWQESKVLFIDIHQDPQTLYPGTGFLEQIGEGKGRGFTINIPLLPFSGNISYRLVFEEIIEPLVKEFKPQIIIRNGGSDPHFLDPLTNLNLDCRGLKMIGEKVRKLAKICQDKEIDLIASGYNLKILPLAWTSLISGLLDFEFEIPKERVLTELPEITKKTKSLVEKIKKQLRPFWQCFR